VSGKFIESITKIICSRWMIWAGHVAQLWADRTSNRLEIEKGEGRDHKEDQDIRGWKILRGIL
jgi:hypothetical protein